jgi:hypothetical protein
MDLTHYIPHALTAAGLGIVCYFGKRYIDKFFDKIEEGFATYKSAIADIKETKALIVDQNENHLTHIEEYTKESKDTLNRMEVSHAETNGYLKAIAGKQ